MSRIIKARWRKGEHITLIGPTGSGKTHLALKLADFRDRVFVIATKRKDPLLHESRFERINSLDDIVWAGDEPVQSRVIFWPGLADDRARVRQQLQAARIRRALDWVDSTGNWTVIIDELMWLSDTLGLRRELDSLWFQGRTQGISVISSAQRPRHVPLLALSQASYIAIWQTSDRQDIERLREISAGIGMKELESAVRSLNWRRHEFLWIDIRRRQLMRSVAPK